MTTAQGQHSRRLAVILHADVADSTTLVRLNESLAHDRITHAFNSFAQVIERYSGTVQEVRGDALVAEFDRASDAVCASIDFQQSNAEYLQKLDGEIRPTIRIGVSLGEVVFADDTVTGEGVVLAQRVEQVAEPEGLCITAAIHEALPKRMPFDQEDLGERELKGFDEEVRVYRVELKAGESIPAPEADVELSSSKTHLPRVRWEIASVALLALVVSGLLVWMHPWQSGEAPALVKHAASPLPVKSSIAVLPFANMSGDPEQEYFSDGISEDIITDLSQLANLDVIARNSSFTYKGKPVKVDEIGRDLGVQYVLEGSVRKAGTRLRITAQLVDTGDGHHLWAKRYDRELTDVFALQDEITNQIVAALSVQLSEEEKRNLGRVATNSFEAYDWFLRGQKTYTSPLEDGTNPAIEMYQKAISLDPNFARVYGTLAITLVRQVLLGYSDSPVETRDRALELARKAVSIDPGSTQALWALGYVLMYRNQFDEAIEAVERAVSLSPSYADGYGLLGLLKNNMGQAEEAIQLIKKGMELNPYYTWDYLYNLGRAYYVLNDYETAIDNLQKAIERNEAVFWPRLYLTASYVQLKQQDEAEWQITELEILDSNLTLSHLQKVLPFENDDLRDHLFNDLRAAGMAE